MAKTHLFRSALGLILLASTAACSTPGIGVGYGAGPVRVGVSSGDLGRTVRPSVSVGQSGVWAGMSGPAIEVLPEARPDEAYPAPMPPAGAVPPRGPVIGRPAPGTGAGL